MSGSVNDVTVMPGVGFDLLYGTWIFGREQKRARCRVRLVKVAERNDGLLTIVDRLLNVLICIHNQ